MSDSRTDFEKAFPLPDVEWFVADWPPFDQFYIPKKDPVTNHDMVPQHVAYRCTCALKAWQAATEQQQSVIAELVEALEDAERLLLESAKPFDSGCMKIKEALAKVKGVKSE